MSQLKIRSEESAPHPPTRRQLVHGRYCRTLNRVATSPWTLAIVYMLVEAARTWCQAHYPAWAEWLAKLSGLFKPR